MVWVNTFNRGLPGARKRFPGVRDLSLKVWPEEGAWGRGRHRIDKQCWTSCCHFKNFDGLNNPFAWGIFSVSAQKSSCIAEKDDGCVHSQLSCVTFFRAKRWKFIGSNKRYDRKMWWAGRKGKGQICKAFMDWKSMFVVVMRKFKNQRHRRW